MSPRTLNSLLMILAAAGAAEENLPDLMKSVRAALGGEAKVASVQTLSILADMAAFFRGKADSPALRCRTKCEST